MLMPVLSRGTQLIELIAAVFLTFWQATGLSVLSMFGVVKDVSPSSTCLRGD